MKTRRARPCCLYVPGPAVPSMIYLVDPSEDLAGRSLSSCEPNGTGLWSRDIEVFTDLENQDVTNLLVAGHRRFPSIRWLPPY